MSKPLVPRRSNGDKELHIPTQAIKHFESSNILTQTKSELELREYPTCGELVDWLEIIVDSGLGNHYLYACIREKDSSKIQRFVITHFTDRLPLTFNLTSLEDFIEFADSVQPHSQNPCAHDLLHTINQRIAKSSSDIRDTPLAIHAGHKAYSSQEVRFSLAIMMNAGSKNDRIRGVFEACIYDMVGVFPPFITGEGFLEVINSKYGTKHLDLLKSSPALIELLLLDWEASADPVQHVIVDFSYATNSFYAIAKEDYLEYQEEGYKAMSLECMFTIISRMQQERKSQFIRIQYEEHGRAHFFYLGTYNSKLLLPPTQTAVVTQLVTK